MTSSTAAVTEPAPPDPAGISAAPPDIAAVYAEHASFVWRVLRSFGVHESLTADAVQDVFIVVHRRYAEFDHRHKLSTWLFEIAYRIASDYRKKSRRARVIFVAEPAEQASDLTPARHAEHNEQKRVLTELLNTLDDDKRAVLVLAEIEGLNASEIAQITGIALNTVYSRLRRARQEFDQALARYQQRHK